MLRYAVVMQSVIFSCGGIVDALSFQILCALHVKVQKSTVRRAV